LIKHNDTEFIGLRNKIKLEGDLIINLKAQIHELQTKYNKFSSSVNNAISVCNEDHNETELISDIKGKLLVAQINEINIQNRLHHIESIINKYPDNISEIFAHELHNTTDRSNNENDSNKDSNRSDEVQSIG